MSSNIQTEIPEVRLRNEIHNLQIVVVIITTRMNKQMKQEQQVYLMDD